MDPRTTVDPILDPAAFSRLERLGGPELVRDMAVLAQEEISRRLARAHASLAALREAAHVTSSSAGNLGARRLQSLARRIAEESRRGESDPPARAAELRAAFALTQAALSEALDALP